VRPRQRLVPAGQAEWRGSHRAGGVQADVAFGQAPQGVGAEIDAAYHTKYDRYGPRIVGTVVGDDAHTVTVCLVPEASRG
jgi:hypothetical protein